MTSLSKAAEALNKFWKRELENLHHQRFRDDDFLSLRNPFAPIGHVEQKESTNCPPEQNLSPSDSLPLPVNNNCSEIVCSSFIPDGVADGESRVSVAYSPETEFSPLDPCKFRTELCRSHQVHGYCRYGTRCNYAHGIEQLRVAYRHGKYKTRNCRSYHDTGFCRYGARCSFIHDAEEGILKCPITDREVLEALHYHPINEIQDAATVTWKMSDDGDDWKGAFQLVNSPLDSNVSKFSSESFNDSLDSETVVAFPEDKIFFPIFDDAEEYEKYGAASMNGVIGNEKTITEREQVFCTTICDKNLERLPNHTYISKFSNKRFLDEIQSIEVPERSSYKHTERKTRNSSVPELKTEHEHSTPCKFCFTETPQLSSLKTLEQNNRTLLNLPTLIQDCESPTFQNEFDFYSENSSRNSCRPSVTDDPIQSFSSDFKKLSLNDVSGWGHFPSEGERRASFSSTADVYGVPNDISLVQEVSDSEINLCSQPLPNGVLNKTGNVTSERKNTSRSSKNVRYYVSTPVSKKVTNRVSWSLYSNENVSDYSVSLRNFTLREFLKRLKVNEVENNKMMKEFDQNLPKYKTISEGDRTFCEKGSTKYKTELCRLYQYNKACEYDRSCLFAHGTEDLRSYPKHTLYRTKKCFSFHKKGFCMYGSRCQFLHDIE